MVSIGGLRAIDAFARHGSMAAAADALGYTPSAVSQQIAKLGRDVRQVLVAQHGRGAVLTEAGRVLAESARRIVAELDGMRDELQARARTVSGSLRLAAFPSAARGLAPAALRFLADRWPELAVTLVEADSRRAVELVACGAVDLAVTHDWVDLPSGLCARHLVDDVVDVLVHRDHRLAGAPCVALADLCGDLTHQVGEDATRVALVAAGVGVALVPRMGRGPLPSMVRAVVVSDGPVRRVYGVWRAATGRRPALEAALGALCPQ